jgi:GTPase SAR1 family protein
MTEENENLYFTSPDPLVFKICVTADPVVDKTNFLNQVVSKRFDERYLPIVGVNISKEQVIINDELGNKLVAYLLFWNIAEGAQWYMLHRPYFSNSDGTIIIYDLSNLNTLNFIPERIRKIRKYARNIPIFLLGIKTNPNIREISNHKIGKINKRFKLSGSYEALTESREALKSIFKKVAKLIYQSKLNA